MRKREVIDPCRDLLDAVYDAAGLMPLL